MEVSKSKGIQKEDRVIGKSSGYSLIFRFPRGCRVIGWRPYGSSQEGSRLVAHVSCIHGFATSDSTGGGCRRPWRRRRTLTPVRTAAAGNGRGVAWSGSGRNGSQELWIPGKLTMPKPIQVRLPRPRRCRLCSSTARSKHGRSSVTRIRLVTNPTQQRHQSVS
jgi:hypothetical protein